MAGIVLKPRARIFHGHDWVYGSEVLKTFGNPAGGDVVSLKDGQDRSLGSAIYNPNSQIIARRFSRRKQELDREFFERRISQASAAREKLGILRNPEAHRFQRKRRITRIDYRPLRIASGSANPDPGDGSQKGVDRRGLPNSCCRPPPSSKETTHQFGKPKDSH